MISIRINKVLKTPLKLFLLLCFSLFLFSCGTTKRVSEPKAQTYQFHTVIKGETIDKIANSYAITQEEIRVLNPGVNFKRLEAGQDIKVPFRKAEVIKEKPEEIKETTLPKKTIKIKIAILLPFNAGLYAENNQTDNTETQIDPSTVPWIHFYNGVEMALDSLSNSGNSFEISVFDSGMDSTRLTRLLRDSIFSKNDLVISGAGNSWLSQLNKAANQNKIPLIVIQNNSASFLDKQAWAYLITPSVALQCQMMSEFIFRKFEKENIIILHQDLKKENDLSAIFKTSLEIERLKSGHTDTLRIKNIIYNEKTFDKVNSPLVKNKKNIFIIPSSDEAFVSPIISRLDSLNEFSFSICGLPTWENFESIDPKKFQNLQTLFFSSTFIDYKSVQINNFRKSFIQKFKADPLYNAYLGFSIVSLAGSVLETYKHDGFNEGIEKANNMSYPVSFNFLSKSKEDGKENHHFTILKFDNYKLVVVE